jgi:hypothetical protein
MRLNFNQERKVLREKSKINTKNYRERNKELLSQKIKDKKKNDPLFRLSDSIRTLIWISINKMGYKKNSKTNNILGWHCYFGIFFRCNACNLYYLIIMFKIDENEKLIEIFRRHPLYIVFEFVTILILAILPLVLFIIFDSVYIVSLLNSHRE